MMKHFCDRCGAECEHPANRLTLRHIAVGPGSNPRIRPGATAPPSDLSSAVHRDYCTSCVYEVRGRVIQILEERTQPSQ